MTALITPEEAQAIAGVALTAPEIATGQGVIETVTGVDFSVAPLPYLARDVRYLKRAVAWQARYMKEHPEVIDQAANLVSASTNGVSVTYDSAGSAGALVSALARMSLRRLSWKGTRSVRMVPGRRPTLSAQTLVIDGTDGEWTPLR